LKFSLSVAEFPAGDKGEKREGKEPVVQELPDQDRGEKDECEEGESTLTWKCSSRCAMPVQALSEVSLIQRVRKAKSEAVMSW
jgi:hypothetical protein